MSRNASVAGILSLSDRFYGAWLGAQIASDLDPEALGLGAMLRRYEPFGVTTPHPSPLRSAQDWTERILHQQLSGVRPAVDVVALAVLPEPMDSTLVRAWQIFCQDLPWEISFKLMDLAGVCPRQKAVLGLWLGAARGPRVIPWARLSPQGIEEARSRSQQIFLTWSGCDERREVGVS